jgi:hypothetical protein
MAETTPEALLEEVQRVHMPIDGITTDMVDRFNMADMTPVNPTFLNFTAVGMVTNTTLGLMPSQADAASLVVLKLLLIIVHKIYLRFLTILLRWGLNLLVSHKHPPNSRF